MTSPFEIARENGYSDEEIMKHLETHPKYSDKINKARQQGYSNQEISSFLSTYQPKKEETKKKPERSLLEKTSRVAGQFALGAAENLALPYEIGAASLNSKEAQQIPYRENLFESIEALQQMKELGGDPGSGKAWDEQDQKLLDGLVEQAKNANRSEPFIQTADVGIRGLAEKATGLDLKPEGILENAANWTGFIKNPTNIKELAKAGLRPKDAMKAVGVSGSDAMRGLGVGTALEMAKEGDFGPIGTMASVVIGDIAGGGISGAAKGAKALITEPKKTLAEFAAKFTSKEKLDFQKEIIKDFRDAGLQADIGSITNSDLLKWTQSRLAQSGLTGKALEEFKETLTNQIKDEYKVLAESLGEARFASTHEAGEVAKSYMKATRDADLAATRKLYENANKSLKEKAFVDSRNLANAINNIEKNLKPGQLKSGEQSSVLSAIERLKRDIFDSEGKLMYGNVKDLMNNKIALNDIINYEVQGGAKQLLKGIVGELDRAIISHGKENPTFAKNYVMANKRFSEHAKTFRNKVADQLMRSEDPSQIINKMNNIQGIRSIEKILGKSPEGRKTFGDLKRLKFDKTIGDNLIDSTSQQAKLGTFSKLLEKGKNREIIREILGASSFKRLEKLQKNAGRLADAAQKFYNASKSGTVAVDAAVIAQGMSAIANMLIGNPWPLMKITGGVLGARKLSNLLGDAEFLKLVENAILSAEKGSESQMINSFERLRPYILPLLKQNNESNQ